MQSMDAVVMDKMLIVLAIISTVESSYLWDTYFSRQDGELFPCYNRPDGKYPLENPFKYLVCKNGIAKTHNCGKGEIFVPSCNKCLIQVHAQRGSFCNGRASISSAGKVIKYQNPWDCKSWLECISGSPREYLCDAGLQFSPDEQQCIANARECTLAQHNAQQLSGLFLGKPKQIDAAFLWPDKDVVLIDESTFYKFKARNAAFIAAYPLALYDIGLNKMPSDVDASLTMPDEKVYFFKGSKVWSWGSDDNPRYIKDEWKGAPDNIDAAFYWQDNSKVYFFKKEFFYRFDPISRSVETGYPKLISQGWPGASAPIDAAISLVNGTVFFFKEHTVLTFHPPICRGNKSFLSNIQYSIFSTVDEK